ncbi:protein cab-1-like [Daphnia pulex]|uniref:protein cab-1-like n=1 Tax=Daphnia pulex TaxID=6669 RepID=UPI001EDDD522|nr:protein cab-1-like [Daphnia pulex]
MVNRWWWWLLAFLLVATQHCLVIASSQHRSYLDAVEDTNNGPEDLFLDELVRNLKWKAAQQQKTAHIRQRLPQLTDIRLMDEDDYAEQDGDNMSLQPKMEQQQEPQQEPKNFAYRPHDDRFRNQRPPHQPVRQIKTFNPLIQPAAVPSTIPLQMSSNDIRMAGQKETDIFDEGPVTMSQQQQQQPAPGMGKFMESSPAVASQEEADESVESRISRDPVAHAIVSPAKTERIHDSLADIYLTALVAGCTASVVAALLALGVCFYRWQRRAKAAQEVEYPAYGITGPGPSPSGKSSLKSSPSSTTPGGGIGSWALGKTPKSMASSGDKKLAHSAHMFHFQHQKQQVIALESHSGCDRRGSNSGGESDEDNEEGDYTVYECPGLAPTGEMEVKNPLFLDDPTPATPAAVKRQSK